jgi:hypothetical protein
MSERLIALVDPGKEDGMKPAWHGPGLCCLVTALCLVACDGSSTPSDYPAETSKSAAETPALVYFTPEAEPSFSQEDSQAPATDLETAATVDPSSDVRTPVLVFFTPETESPSAQESPQAPATDQETAATVDPSSGVRTPAPVFFTPATDQTNRQEFQVDAGTPGPQFTRVALPLTPPATIMPRPTGATVTPRATTGSQASPASGEAPFARWPKGWCLGVGAVVVILLAAWLLAWRRR